MHQVTGFWFLFTAIIWNLNLKSGISIGNLNSKFEIWNIVSIYNWEAIQVCNLKVFESIYNIILNLLRQAWIM